VQKTKTKTDPIYLFFATARDGLRGISIYDAISILSIFAMANPYLSHLRLLARHNRWAHGVLGRSLDGTPHPSAAWTADAGLFACTIRGTLNHIALADLLWLQRLTGYEHDPKVIEQVTSAVVPSLAEMITLWGDNSGAASSSNGEVMSWDNAVRGPTMKLLDYTSSRLEEVVVQGVQSDAQLSERISYRDTLGAPRTQVRGLALLHVFGHAVHHRGQASAAITRFGGRAPEMDLTYFLASLPPGDLAS
jgi:uncharacterized damage-inducible protein DinB